MQTIAEYSYAQDRYLLGINKTNCLDKARQNGCIDDYTFALSQSLWTWKMDYDDVEQYYNDIISAWKKAATETFPTVSFKKHLKPYWN